MMGIECALSRAKTSTSSRQPCFFHGLGPRCVVVPIRNHCRISRSPSISSEQQSESGGVSGRVVGLSSRRTENAVASRFHRSMTWLRAPAAEFETGTMLYASA